MEKLIVEFGVRKSIARDFGYEEKLLMHREEDIPYKAILKDGKVVAIVSRRYSLIENERVVEVVKKIAENEGYELDIKNEFPRLYCFLMKDDYGFLVANSVDGSISLRIDLILKLNNVPIAIRTEELTKFYRRHIGNIRSSINKISDIMKEVVKYKDKIKLTIDEMSKIYIKDIKDSIEALKEILPKKYFKDIHAKMLDGELVTLKDVYVATVTKIWNQSPSMKRTIKLYQKLNRIILRIVMMK